jgi:hypothetical protein
VVLAEAAGLLERAGLPDGDAWVLGYESYVSLAGALVAAGEPDRARRVLAPLLAVAQREPWVPVLAAVAAADGHALAALGQSSAARGQLDRAARLPARLGLPHVRRAADAAAAELS